MLHIFRSRKFAKRTLLGILILIIPAFVLWGAGNISQGPGLIGTIGKQKITADEFAESLQGVKIQLLLSYSNYDQFRNIMQNRPLVNRMAWDRLVFLNAAQKDKIEVTNQDVIAYLSRHPIFQKDGSFDKWTYYYIVKNTLGMEPRTFEELIRENLEVNAFQNTLYGQIKVSDEELLKYYHVLKDVYDVSFIIIDKEQFDVATDIPEEDIVAYYRSNTVKFQTPAKIDIEYVDMPYEDAAQKEEVSEKMGALYTQLQKYPTTFEETAEKNGVHYHRTGPISAGELIPGTAFSKRMHDIAFSMGNGEVTPPVFSGDKKGTAYILHKLDSSPQALPAFEDIRETVIEEIGNEKQIQLAGQQAVVIYKDIAAGNTTFSQAAQDLGLEVSTAEGVSAQGYIENIGPARSIIERSFNVDAGGVIPPVYTPGGMVITRIDMITPAEEETFEKEKAAIRQQVLMGQRRNVLEKWMAEQLPNIELKRSLDTL